MISLAACIDNEGDEYNKGTSAPVAQLDSYVYVLTCADPESFVRGSPTLITFFFFFFLGGGGGGHSLRPLKWGSLKKGCSSNS